MSTKKTDTSIASRNSALKILLAVIKDGQSLSSLTELTENLDARDAAFARMISFGVLRFYYQLQAQLKPLMKKPLKAKDLDINLILLMALYQIQHTRVPDYAVVDVSVKQIRKSRKQWAASLVNAILRNFIRQQDNQDKRFASEEAEYSHPQWMINQLKQDWPENWQTVLQGNNAQAPMTLRVNTQKKSTDDFMRILQHECDLEVEKIPAMPAALLLKEARDVTQLPGYNEGWFSVQDAGAQLAAQILQPVAGDHILDACAAPGGKTAHLFEVQTDIQLTALDISESRLLRVKENCNRLGFKPSIVAADATAVDDWWQGELFDKILLDVPCSASGVIRRHPDIKHLRREEDITVLVGVQRDILLKNWALLKPGGRLLYATCSLFKCENEMQIEWFLKHVDDASLVEFPDEILQQQKKCHQPEAAAGLQLFPVSVNHDGFYYALLEKKIS